MDNAGGHRIEKAIHKYKRQLLDHYNVKIFFRQHNYQKSLHLTLGTLDFCAELGQEQHLHKTKSAHALGASVEGAWGQSPLDYIAKMFD